MNDFAVNFAANLFPVFLSELPVGLSFAAALLRVFRNELGASFAILFDLLTRALLSRTTSSEYENTPSTREVKRSNAKKDVMSDQRMV